MEVITAEEIIQRLEESKEISKKLEEALSKGDAPVGEHWQIGITTQLARDIINFINRPCKIVDDKECKTIIKALENCIDMYTNHDNCPYSGGRCKDKLLKDVLITLKRLKEENDDLFYKLAGVMHAVDKWLDGDELEKDEINRAAIMREKTLQITENQQAEIEKVREANRFYERSRLNCQILTLEAFTKKLKNVFVDIDGTFECWEVEEHIDNFLSRQVNEARKDYAAVCQDDTKSYDLIKEVEMKAYRRFAERLKEKSTIEHTSRSGNNWYEIDDTLINDTIKEMAGNSNGTN